MPPRFSFNTDLTSSVNAPLSYDIYDMVWGGGGALLTFKKTLAPPSYGCWYNNVTKGQSYCYHLLHFYHSHLEHTKKGALAPMAQVCFVGFESN